MAVNRDGVSSGLRVEAVGLSRGVCATVARVTRRSRGYVYKVAVGAKRGNPAIRRQLARRGWQDPRAVASPEESAA